LKDSLASDRERTRKDDSSENTPLWPVSERIDSDLPPGVLLNELAAFRLENPKVPNCFSNLGLSENVDAFNNACRDKFIQRYMVCGTMIAHR
jgi:hypothetical protein